MSFVTPKEIRHGLIMKRVQEHYDEALQYFPEEQIVGIFLQGSQNYDLDYEGSDVDTKLIVVPSFKDICLNRKPVSTTHVRENNEHIDWKDVRKYVEEFRKQNLNFLEILFTDFYIINPMYEAEWNRLVEARESIARMNPFRAVKSMKGIAHEKYAAMEKPYPSKIAIIEKYGYDGKQNSHLERVDDYLQRYIAGESYEACLKPTPSRVPHIMDYKMLSVIPLEEARAEAKKTLAHVDQIANEFCEGREDKEEPWIRELLEDVSYNIMRIAVEKELLK
jgi:predicted nucleotidyltransferase